MRKESQNESEISMTDIVSVRGNNLTLVAISLSWDRKTGVVNHLASVDAYSVRVFDVDYVDQHACVFCWRER